MIGRAKRASWLLAMAFAWGWAWRHLSIEWLTNEQYQYALGVPLLGIYLGWRRWRGPFGEGRAAWPRIAILVGWVAFAFGELLRWHDPIWRMTGALLAAGATLVTAAGCYRIGGTPLLKRERFPIFFAWSAVPWPMGMELFVTQHLLHFVTTFTATVLGLMGIGVLQQGNAIEMANGILGIDEACSGIRSLQATLMATLFLGEYFRLPKGRRAALVAGGLLVAGALNCARVLALGLVMHARGSDTATLFHDKVGTATTAITFLCVLAIALFLRHGRAELEEDTAGAVSSPGPPISRLAFNVEEDTAGVASAPSNGGIFVCAAFMAIPLLTWIWFARIAAGDSASHQPQQWTLSWSRLGPEWKADSVEPRPGQHSALRFSTWQGCELRTPGGWTARILHIGWNRGESMPSLAFYHTPELCMPWLGWTEIGQPEKMDLPLQAGPMPCMAYRFVQDGVGMIVLQSLSSGGINGYHIIDPNHTEGRWHRLRTLWRAPMRQVNEELLLYMPDFGPREACVPAATHLLDAVIQHGK